MADEPDNLVLLLLRDIRSTQETHGADLKYLKGRVDDLYKISTHTLGVAVNAHERYEIEGDCQRVDEAPSSDSRRRLTSE
jgi:hypothetical protein